MHQRFSKSVEKPASGPEYSVPATGCAGTIDTEDGRCCCKASTTVPLTEPTSETIAPAFKCLAISMATSAVAPTGTQRTIRSDASTEAAMSCVTLLESCSSFARWHTIDERSARTIVRAKFLARATLARDEPISPIPMIVIFSNSGSLRTFPDTLYSLEARARKFFRLL